MRFIEFADPKPYTVSVDDADTFLDHLETVWPKNDVGTEIPRKAMCKSHGADRVTQPSHRRQPSVRHLQLRT